MCFEACHLAWMLSRPNSCTQSYNQTPPYGHPLNSDTSFLRTVCFVPEKRRPLNIFSKFNPLNTDTPLIGTLSMPSSESVFTGFNRIRLSIDWYFIYPRGRQGTPFCGLSCTVFTRLNTALDYTLDYTPQMEASYRYINAASNPENAAWIIIRKIGITPLHIATIDSNNGNPASFRRGRYEDRFHAP